MSNHHGRCSRAFRRTKERKARQGIVYNRPIRWKVPKALRPFLAAVGGNSNQRMAGFDAFANATAAYARHRALTGQGAPIRGEEAAG